MYLIDTLVLSVKRYVSSEKSQKLEKGENTTQYKRHT